jgi:hypothetical protein
MTGFGAQRGLRNRSLKRQVIDVPEKQPEDKRLDMLLHVRRQRLVSLEHECQAARMAWREQRRKLRDAKQRREIALQDAKDYWQQACKQFFSMVTTSGEFRRAKAGYGRMKEHAAQLYLECQQSVQRCRSARTTFFEVRARVRTAKRQQEKLGMLRDEMRILTQQNEMQYE